MIHSVATALGNTGQPAQFSVKTKAAVDFEVVEARAAVKRTAGFLQPTPARELKMLPEGQRDWKHWTYYTRDRLQLDWELLDPQGLQYRVLESRDWSQAGYHRYLLQEQPKVQ